jgi:hypothetical protein
VPDVHNITRGDTQILLVDLAGITDERIVPGLVEKATQLAREGQGPGTVRTLLDLSGTRITRRIQDSLMTLSRDNGRYAKATAFVGVKGAWRFGLSVLFRLRGKRNHRVLPTREAASDWLARW